MGRRPRIDGAGAWHHVMNRGINHQPVFRDDRDRTDFIGLLASVVAGRGLEVHGFCLVGNHYHLLLRCPDGGLSASMQRLASRYTRAFNERSNRDGPLFRGRFHSKLIRSDPQLIRTSRYIHRNALDVEGVTELDRYPWSSYRAYVGSRAPIPWLSTDVLLAMIGGAARYRAFVERDDDVDAA